MSSLSDLRAEIDATDALAEHIRSVVDRLVARSIERGAEAYRREQHLPPLLGRSWEIMTDAEIIARLQRKIFAESKRLQAGHWTADSNRLLALRQALAAEQKMTAWHCTAGQGRARRGRARPGMARHGKSLGLYSQ